MPAARTACHDPWVNRLVRLAVTSTCLVALAATAAAPAGAATAPQLPKVPKVKTRIAKVQISLTGYVETRLLHDTTSDCFPGERWIQTNRYDFRTGGFRNISMKRITGDGFDPVVTSPFSAPAGSARIAGAISEYRTTNHCAPTAPGPVDPAPDCTETSGKTSISMQEGVVRGAREDGLVPLTQTPLMLAIRRTGGGKDAARCVGPGAAQVSGEDTEKAVVTTSIMPGIPAVIVPSGFSVIKVFNIRPGQRLRKAIVVSGPCSNVALRAVPAPGGAPGPGGLNADGDCFLTGKITYTITPRPKKD